MKRKLPIPAGVTMSLLAGALSVALMTLPSAASAQHVTRPMAGTDCIIGPQLPVRALGDAIGAARTSAAARPCKPEIEATEEAIGAHIVKGMAVANSDGNEVSGIHYPENFRDTNPGAWKNAYWKGYANPKFWKHVGYMKWRLKPGVSASEAVKDWLKGRTIAECLSTLQAVQTDALRAAIGNASFDKKFGEAHRTTREDGRLVIGDSVSSVNAFLKPTDGTFGQEGTLGMRPVKIGEHYYFGNHPKYLLKHPDGSWQGENAIYLGKKGGVQMWSGFGATEVSEQGMIHEMVQAYNAPRSARDIEILKSEQGPDPRKWPKRFQEKSGGFPDKITAKDLLDAPAFSSYGTLRKGGFDSHSGLKLNVGEVRKLRCK